MEIFLKNLHLMAAVERSALFWCHYKSFVWAASQIFFDQVVICFKESFMLACRGLKCVAAFLTSGGSLVQYLSSISLWRIFMADELIDN